MPIHTTARDIVQSKNRGGLLKYIRYRGTKRKFNALELEAFEQHLNHFGGKKAKLLDEKRALI
jgi:hypothetical protein